MKFQREYLCIIAQQEMVATNEEIITALKGVGLNVQTIQACQLDELDRVREENNRLRGSIKGPYYYEQ